MKKIMLLSLLGASIIAGAVAIGSVASSTDKEVVKPTTSDLLSYDDKLEGVDNNAEVKLDVDNTVEFTREAVKNNPTFNTQWKTNSKGTASICIEGKGEDAIEEGEGYIYLKLNGKINKISMTTEDGIYTPVYVEWVSDNEFIVQTAPKHGTIRTGGKMYKLTVDDLTAYLLYEMDDNEKLVDTFQINDDTISVKTFYDGNGRARSNDSIIKFK